MTAVFAIGLVDNRWGIVFVCISLRPTIGQLPDGPSIPQSDLGAVRIPLVITASDVGPTQIRCHPTRNDAYPA